MAWLKGLVTASDIEHGAITPIKLDADMLANIRLGVSVIVHPANPTYQVQLLSGAIVGDSTGAVEMTVGSTLMADITNSGANGLDTGAEAASTRYYFWLIQKSSDGTQAALLSTSSSDPTMPAGYDIKALIGWLYNNADSDFDGVWLTGEDIGPDHDVADLFVRATPKELMPNLKLTGTDDGDGTGWMAVRVGDALGSNLSARFLIRTWIADADFSEADPQTGFSVAVGEQMRELEANADYEVITNSNGLVDMEINTGGAKTVYVMAELDGRIYSKQLDITVP